MALTLTSSAFSEGGGIPKKFTCDGADISPPLAWKNAPAKTQSFVLIMDDPDAPPGTWVHWLIYNIPATLPSLEEGVLKQADLPNGARQGACWGVDTFNRVGYYGPCPPPGAPHRYFFKLYALDVLLKLPAKAAKPQLEAAMQGHILEKAVLMGKYGR